MFSKKLHLSSVRFTCTLIVEAMDINLNEELRAPLTAVRKSVLVLTPELLLEGNKNSRTGDSTEQDASCIYNSNRGCTMTLILYLLVSFMFDYIMLKRALFKVYLKIVKKDYCGISLYLYY